MRVLSRTIFREIATSALLGTLLFTFVLFLQKVGKDLFQILVRSSAPPSSVGHLFALILPPTLTFTVPLGVLVGILIALSRMSSDGEIIAMRAAGVPSRTVMYPVLVFAFLAMLVAGACSLWLTPFSVRETYRIMNHLAASQLTAQIQPRTFQEEFPNAVLYVSDVALGTGPAVKWKNLFLADVTPPEEAGPAGKDRGPGPRITIAAEAIAVPDVEHNRIQLTMLNGSTHEVDKDGKHNSTSFPAGDQTLEAQKRSEKHASRASVEMDTLPLYRLVYRNKPADKKDWIEAAIELHQRLALPPACLLLALVGIPLGVSSRKSGKSTAFVLTVFLAFLYYMALIGLMGLARQEALPVAVAAWIPNVLFAVVGLVFMMRLEAPGDRDWIGLIRNWVISGVAKLRGSLPSAPAGIRKGGFITRWLVPQIVDTYVLSTFLFYFVVLLASLVLMVHVFTFFELLSDMVKNKIPMSRMLTYLLFLTPKLIYDSTPISVLVGILITFGILTKHNEVTALKAGGISLYRLAVPLLLISAVMSAALFGFDHYYVPEANRKQDAIRNEIKGRPVQTYLRPDRKWINGQGSRIFYYRYLDPAQNVMLGVSVYDLNPNPFRLRSQISAEQARWEPSLHAWVFQNGWREDLEPGHQRFLDFRGSAATFPELTETPGYFLKEVKQYKQMNFKELATYISELQQSGLDTVGLQVQFHKKFSVPLFAAIMALISIPFAFFAGNRGAMAGVGISFGIAIAYWAIGQLFEQVGNLNQLPPVVAAWSPDALFSLGGLYFFTKMRS